MKRILGFLSIAIFACTCGQAADMHLVKSAPTDGSVTDKPPATFVLEFSEQVKLHNLSLRRDDEKRPKSVSDLPSGEATAFTIPAPALAPGGYTLEWRVFVNNSRAVTGRVRFTVSGAQLGTTLSPTH